MGSAAGTRAVQRPLPSASDSTLASLVLAGGGHSHALVLRLWALRPQLRPAAGSITLVSRSGTSLYSGLVPAVVAGLHRRSDCAIDLRWLCERVGVRFLEAEITGLDLRSKQLLLRGLPPLPYGRLSLDVGAVTDRAASAAAGQRAALSDIALSDVSLPDVADAHEDVDGNASRDISEPMAVKPLEPFLEWCGRLEPGRALRLRGGGAVAVELALALRGRGHPCTLLLRGESLHLGSAAANRAGERLLQRAGIELVRGAPPAAPADLLCTGSRAPLWLAAAGLPVDPARGRVLCDADLRVCGHGDLFVSGDCGVLAADPRPPSGVWAVRAAPVLAENLRRSLLTPSPLLRRWRPRRFALQLLADGSTARPAAEATGEREVEAVALWGPFAFGPSRLLGRWKARIDRSFMAQLGTVASGRDSV